MLTVQGSPNRAFGVHGTHLRSKNENVSGVSHPGIWGVNSRSRRKSACVVLLSSENISIRQKGSESVPQRMKIRTGDAMRSRRGQAQGGGHWLGVVGYLQQCLSTGNGIRHGAAVHPSASQRRKAQRQTAPIWPTVWRHSMSRVSAIERSPANPTSPAYFPHRLRLRISMQRYRLSGLERYGRMTRRAQFLADMD